MTTPSAPLLKIHGCLGWKATHNTPTPPTTPWPRRTFRGTMRGFLDRSLEGGREGREGRARVRERAREIGKAVGW